MVGADFWIQNSRLFSKQFIFQTQDYQIGDQ